MRIVVAKEKQVINVCKKKGKEKQSKYAKDLEMCVK